MRPNLARILRIRRLQEEIQQLEFENLAAELERLNAAAERQRRSSQEARQLTLDLLRGRGLEGSRMLIEREDAAILQQRIRALRARASASTPAAEEARQRFVDRRIERRQIESLLDAAASMEARESLRREQKLLDEWFQTRGIRRRSP